MSEPTKEELQDLHDYFKRYHEHHKMLPPIALLEQLKKQIKEIEDNERLHERRA